MRTNVFYLIITFTCPPYGLINFLIIFIIGTMNNKLNIINPISKIKSPVLLIHGVCEIALTPVKSRNLQLSSIPLKVIINNVINNIGM